MRVTTALNVAALTDALTAGDEAKLLRNLRHDRVTVSDRWLVRQIIAEGWDIVRGQVRLDERTRFALAMNWRALTSPAPDA
jgi:hypothetical protein